MMGDITTYYLYISMTFHESDYKIVKSTVVESNEKFKNNINTEKKILIIMQ